MSQERAGGDQGSKPSLIVVGNCQAWALTAMLKQILPGVQVEKPIAVHLLNPQQEEAFTARLDGADLIMSQLVSETFPLPFVRTDVIKDRHNADVTTWLNLYYRGQNPELCYKREVATRDFFPLGDYHIDAVYDGFVEGAPVDEVLRRMADPVWNEERYGNVAKESLEELRTREQLADAAISDQIALREESEQLFFTFNHPALQVFADYALRLAQAMGFEPSSRVSIGMMGEPLARIVVPANPMTRRGRLSMTLPGPRTYRGSSLSEDPESAQPVVPTVLTERQVVERFYDAYREIGLTARPTDASSTRVSDDAHA